GRLPRPRPRPLTPLPPSLHLPGRSGCCPHAALPDPRTGAGFLCPGPLDADAAHGRPTLAGSFPSGSMEERPGSTHSVPWLVTASPGATDHDGSSPEGFRLFHLRGSGGASRPRP